MRAIVFIIITTLASSSARASVLFENPWTSATLGPQWCSPCSTSTADWRVYDSFSLSSDSTIQSVTWVDQNTAPPGSTLIEIFDSTRTTSLFSQVFTAGEITTQGTIFSNYYIENQPVRTISLPNIALNSGDYWISIFGQNQYVAFTGVLSGGDNSLVQIYLSSNSTYYRQDDGAFRLEGVVGSVAAPLPAALPLFATGLGALGLIGWRRKKKAAALPA